MENKNINKDFKYTYSAKEQDEILKIRQKYQPKEEDKMEYLRRLDAQVTRKATMMSISIGIIGALIMGSGMSMIMTKLGEHLGLSGIIGMIVGISIGVIGMVCVCVAYPVYNVTLRKEREKIAPEIFRLTEELMK